MGTHYLDDSSPTATPEFYLLLLLLPSLSLFSPFLLLSYIGPAVSVSLHSANSSSPLFLSLLYTSQALQSPSLPVSSVAGPLLYPFSSLDELVCTLCVPSL